MTAPLPGPKPDPPPDLPALLVELAARIDAGFADLRDRLGRRTKSHLTVDEVAELTGRAPYTVRRWIKEGRLSAQRLTDGGPRGRLLVPREQLHGLIAGGFGAAVPDAAVP